MDMGQGIENMDMGDGIENMNMGDGTKNMEIRVECGNFFIGQNRSTNQMFFW